MHCEEICEYEGGAQGRGNSIYCDSCETWMHWACEGLSPQDGGVLGNSDSDYMCTLCAVPAGDTMFEEGPGCTEVNPGVIDLSQGSLSDDLVNGSSVPDLFHTATVVDDADCSRISMIASGVLHSPLGLTSTKQVPEKLSNSSAQPAIPNHSDPWPEVSIADPGLNTPKTLSEKSHSLPTKLVVPSSRLCNGRDLNKDLLEVDPESGVRDGRVGLGASEMNAKSSQSVGQTLMCTTKSKKSSRKSQVDQVSVSVGLSENENSNKNMDKGRNKLLKNREHDLSKREQECNEMVKQLATIKAKVIQQEHLITELENSKKILETQLILTKRASADSPSASMNIPVASNESQAGQQSQHLMETKVLFLEQRMHLLEMDCLMMRQDALRAEQLRLLELQQNLSSVRPDAYLRLNDPYHMHGISQQYQPQGLGNQILQPLYMNRMDIPVVTPGFVHPDHLRSQAPAQESHNIQTGSSSSRVTQPGGVCAREGLQKQNSRPEAVSRENSMPQDSIRPEGVHGEALILDEERETMLSDTQMSRGNDDAAGEDDDSTRRTGMSDNQLRGDGASDKTIQVDAEMSQKPSTDLAELSQSQSFLWSGPLTAKPPWMVLQGQGLKEHQMPTLMPTVHLQLAQQYIPQGMPVPPVMAARYPQHQLIPIPTQQRQFYRPQGFQPSTLRTSIPINYIWKSC